MKKFHILTLSLISTGCIAFMVSGSDYLESPVKLFFNFPAGNLVTWMGLVSMAILTKAPESAKQKPLISNILITAAWSWLPLGYLVSGNVSFSFKGTDLGWQLWLSYSLIIVFGSIISISWSMIRKKSKKADKNS
ncbi:hypothetical protein AB2B38_010360 [Balneola sp. MJW-20]|uniref:hypothetical protein n=1 Tax=Gracilimonas aurantiaca TaxID=3234185 RepID=UPI0034668AFA